LLESLVRLSGNKIFLPKALLMTLIQKRSKYHRELFYKENLHRYFKNNRYVFVYYVNNIKLSDWHNLQEELRGKITQLESQRIKNSFTSQFLKFSKLQSSVCSLNGPICMFFFNEFEDCFTLLNTIEKSKFSSSKFLALGLFSDDKSYDVVKLNEIKNLDKTVYYKLLNQLEILSI